MYHLLGFVASLTTLYYIIKILLKLKIIKSTKLLYTDMISINDTEACHCAIKKTIIGKVCPYYKYVKMDINTFSHLRVR